MPKGGVIREDGRILYHFPVFCVKLILTLLNITIL